MQRASFNTCANVLCCGRQRRGGNVLSVRVVPRLFMSEPVAEIKLDRGQLGRYLAERVSQVQLTPNHFWNRYVVSIEVSRLTGEITGCVVKYYLEAEEGELQHGENRS